MSFYQRLSAYYDEIFAVRPDELRFLAERLAGKKRLLDIGCGTGNKTVHFASPANSIVAVDLNPDMIARARKDNARGAIHYEVMDMLDVGARFAPSSFDGVLCLGNTLVHLDSPAAMGDFLHGAFTLLAPEGTLVLQILNYDRILDRKVETLPAIDTEHLLFTRRYVWKDGALRFMTVLTVKESGETLKSDIPLYPLRRGELTGLLQHAGYTGLEYYGDFAGKPYDDDAFVTIAVCGKPPSRR